MPNKKNKGFRLIRPNVTSPKAPVLYMMIYVVFASAAMTKTKEQVELGCSVPVHDGYIQTVSFRTVLQSCAQ